MRGCTIPSLLLEGPDRERAPAYAVKAWWRKAEKDGVLTASALLAAAAIFPTSHGRFLLLMYAMAISLCWFSRPRRPAFLQLG